MAETLGGLSVALGAKLKSFRDTAKLNQAQVAELVGLSRASISNIEHGRQPVTIETLMLIAKALHVSLKDLLPDDDEIQRKEQDRLFVQSVGLSHGNS